MEKKSRNAVKVNTKSFCGWGKNKGRDYQKACYYKYFLHHLYYGALTFLLQNCFSYVLYVVECLFMPDKEEFGEIYRTFLDKIYRFVFFLVHDEALAEDITQNTFLKAWKNIRSFDTKRGTMQAFLYSIARNLVIDNQRKKKAIRLEIEIEGLVPSNENLEENVINAESYRELRKTMEKLPDEDREIVALKYFEDMEYPEIAKITGKKEGAIRVRIHRALKLIREYLEKGTK